MHSTILKFNCRCLKKHSFRKLSGLSYIHQIGREPLQAATLGSLFEQSAQKFGDKISIVSLHDDRRISFEELLTEANKLAAGLQSLGLNKGDKVGLWAPNLIEWVVSMVANAQAGLITVALNPINHHKEDLAYSINKVGINAMICPDEAKQYKFYDTLCDLLPELQSHDPGRLASKKTPTLKSVITVSKKSLRGTYSYYDVLDAADEAAVDKMLKLRKSNSPDDICNIQFTSGTTGNPKATCTGHFQQVNNSYCVGKRFGLNPKSNICVQLPFFHAFGTIATILAPQHYGSTITLPSPTYSSGANLKALEKEQCTHICGTPTMFVDLVNLQVKEQRSLNVSTALTGGSPCSPQLFMDMKQKLKFQKVTSVYGMTETTAVSFQSLPTYEEDYKVTNTVGHIGDHLEAKVVDENQMTVPFGVPGELCIRGYSTMLGYWGDEHKTKEVLSNDRWYKTGDQFVLEKNGYGRIVGRLKDMIIRGGENIFPKEIEDVLNAHPDILESQVIGLSHQRLGEEVCACLRLKADVKFNYDNIIEFCQEKLASYKLPSQIKVIDSFPKTASGKIQKIVLRERIEKQLVL